MHLTLSINHTEKSTYMKQFRILGLFLAVLFMVACSEEEEKVSGNGDVMMIAKQSGTQTIYGISIYAYTLNAFQSVTVNNGATPPVTYELQPYEGYKTSFYYETPESEYTSIKPAAATYTFTATFANGETQTFTNTLTDKVLTAPVITKCEYNDVENSLEVTWEPKMGVSRYTLNIYDEAKLVFGSPQLPFTQLQYFVNTRGSGWTVGFTPVTGKTYTVRLLAYLAEPGAGNYNMQSVSIAESPVVWGD